MGMGKPPVRLMSALHSANRAFIQHSLSHWKYKPSQVWAIGGTCVLVLILGLLWPRSAIRADSIQRIEQVLKADSKTSEGATTVAEIAIRMRAIDLKGCPTEFVSAYIAHVHAWEEAATVEREFAEFSERYNSGNAFVEAFVRGIVFDFGMIGEASSAQSELRTKYQRANSQIQQTFHRVEEIAVELGATLPRELAAK